MTTAERKAKLAYWRRVLAWNEARLKKAKGAARHRYLDRIVKAKAAIHALQYPAPDKPVFAKGVDVSGNNGPVDYHALKAAGNTFVYIKAGEGDWPPTKDPWHAGFLDAVKAARAVGLEVGAYHYLKPKVGRTGGQEAALFIARLKAAGIGPHDLRPALDSEETTLSPTDTGKYVQAFADAISFNFGVKPLIYTYPSFPDKWPAALAHYPLWLADYDGPLDVPAPWKGEADVVLHQYSAKGKVPGVAKLIDLDRTPDLRKLRGA